MVFANSKIQACYNYSHNCFAEKVLEKHICWLISDTYLNFRFHKEHIRQKNTIVFKTALFQISTLHSIFPIETIKRRKVFVQNWRVSEKQDYKQEQWSD